MAPLILTSDGAYVVAAQVESFYHYDTNDGTSLCLRTTSGEEWTVIKKTNPQKEATLFKNIGFQIVHHVDYPDLPCA